MDIRPIETIYNGYRFRSRLEARWAVFFDALRVKYEYEPEGYKFDGALYLPDFRIKNVESSHGRIDELYVEVKGVMTTEDAKKIRSFAAHYPVLVLGPVPKDYEGCREESYEDIIWCRCNPFNFELIDGDYFGLSLAADHNGVLHLEGDDSSYIEYSDKRYVYDAYSKARQVRFEFEERKF